MKLSHEDYDQISVLAIRGDMTADHVETFRALAHDRMDHDARDFVLDLSEMEFIDSQGLETLLWLQETCGEKLGQVRLTTPQDNVKTILHVTRLAARFDQHEDVETAIRSLR